MLVSGLINYRYIVSKNVSILSICTQSVFVQLQKMSFFQWVGWGGVWGASIQVGPTFFFICSYFFLKMPYYPSFFTLKCHLRVKIQNYFLARSDLYLTNDIFQGVRCKTSFFNFNPKGLSVKLLLLSQLLSCLFSVEFTTIPTFLHQ